MPALALLGNEGAPLTVQHYQRWGSALLPKKAFAY